MDQIVKSPVMLYTEQTPNPESLKFVLNKMLFRGTADLSDRELATEWSPMAMSLYELPYVKAVYISNNFITITKEFNYAWEDIMLKAKEHIKKYVEDEGVVIKDGFTEAQEKLAAEKTAEAYTGDEADLVVKIKGLIDTYVKPAVEMDGGNIEFKRYDAGKVYVIMQGSCSGCPSSTVTLKSGIEGMLKRMCPEVTEVIQEMG